MERPTLTLRPTGSFRAFFGEMAQNDSVLYSRTGVRRVALGESHGKLRRFFRSKNFQESPLWHSSCSYNRNALPWRRRREPAEG